MFALELLGINQWKKPVQKSQVSLGGHLEYRYKALTDVALPHHICFILYRVHFINFVLKTSYDNIIY